MLTKAFIEKVHMAPFVDTRKYRYRVRTRYGGIFDDAPWNVIERIPLKDLDTTEAFLPWEEVWSSDD